MTCARLAGFWVCLLLGSFVRADIPLDLHEYQGRVVYLDFWASWCGPCRQSFPWMQWMKNSYQDQGLTVIAVNLDKSRAEADKFLSHFTPTFEVRFDPNGALANLYKVHAMPSSVLIDRHGAVRVSHEGFRPVDEPAFEAQVRELLAEK